MNSFLVGLNDEQRKAVSARAPRILVSAGAGTGKTKTLVARYIRRLLEREDPRPSDLDHILAITYTDAAAAEMAQRIEATLRECGQLELAHAMGRARISTIHGFCSRVLRTHALEAQLDPSFQVLTADRATLLMGQAFDRLLVQLTETAEPTLLELLRFVSRRQLKQALFSLLAQARTKGLALSELVPEELPAGEDNPLAPPFALGARLLASAMLLQEHYDALKQEQSSLDFDDLILSCRRLFAEQPALAQQYHEQFIEIMIDEFQDTNRTQLALFEQLNPSSLFMVGDAKQSIYRFQNADVSIFIEQAARARAHEDAYHTLTVNYRSHKAIVDVVNTLFEQPALFGAHETERAEADNTSSNEDFTYSASSLTYEPLTAGGDAAYEEPLETHIRLAAIVPEESVSLADRGVAEAAWIAHEFAELRDEQQYRPRDMVILVTRRSLGAALVTALDKEGFKALIIGGGGFLGAAAVQAARDLLAALHNPAEDALFTRLLLSPLGRLGDQGLYELASFRRARQAEGKYLCLWEASACAELTLSDAHDRKALVETREMFLRAERDLGSVPLSVVLMRAFEERDVDEYFLAQGADGLQEFANLQKLRRLADEFQSGGGGLLEFTRFLDEQEELGARIDTEVPLNEGEGFVRIMTIHAAKGLQFPVVAVPSAREIKDPQASSRKTFVVAGTPPRLGLHFKDLGDTRKKTDRTPAAIAAIEADKQGDAEEGQRCFYVACTRAEEQLRISYSSDGNGLSGTLAAAVASAGLTTEILPVTAGAAVGEESEERAPGSETELYPNPSQHAELSFTHQQRAAHSLPIPPEITQISYSDIEAFRDDRQRFYEDFILRRGRLSDPQHEPARARGSLMHQLLEMATGGSIDITQARYLFQRNGITAREGTRILTAAQYILDSASGQAFMKGTAPQRERQFYLALTDTARHTCRYLKGYIDAQSQQGDGTLLILDYKSGTREKTTADYQLQANCYALVALTEGYRNVRVTMIRPEVIDEEQGSPEEFSFDYTIEERKRLEQELLEAIHDMEDFVKEETEQRHMSMRRS